MGINNFYLYSSRFSWRLELKTQRVRRKDTVTFPTEKQ